jgi:formate dehydrogenase subunit gamma
VVSDVDVVTSICDRYRSCAEALIEILHDVQEAFGFIPTDVIPELAARANLSRAEVHGVVSFYHDFRTSPPGRHRISLCRAEACQARGGWQLEAHVRDRLGVDFGETSADGQLTLEGVYCLGNCALGPALRIDDRLCAKVSSARFDELMEGLE